MEEQVLTEIPSYLKQLARLITRGFYQIEDALIMDMLVRHSCMKEKDLEDLLRFDLKLLRARMATLKNEKLVQIRLRMETGVDGKAQKVNYYFINYKSLVNVIKYKLDHIRKRIETQARDATNRASFKCTNCSNTFTDLEAGDLYDPITNQFCCTFCRCAVEEDESGVPKQDSRIMLAKFNEQLSTVFDLLRKAENVKLAPELLEPEPMRGPDDGDANGSSSNRGGVWSGEATRATGNEETRIDISIGDDVAKPTQERKERPVWMTESTVGDYENMGLNTSTVAIKPETSSADKPFRDDMMSDIMKDLLTYEKRDGGGAAKSLLPDSDDEDPVARISQNGSQIQEEMDVDEVGVMDSDEDDDQAVYVSIGLEKIPLQEVSEEQIHRMTPSEKETYIQQYQEMYSHLYD